MSLYHIIDCISHVLYVYIVLYTCIHSPYMYMYTFPLYVRTCIHSPYMYMYTFPLYVHVYMLPIRLIFYT